MSADFLLRTAIRDRRLVTFTLHDLSRRAEPHDYGIINGEAKLFFYQVGGQSKSGRPFGWRWAAISELADLQVLTNTFAGDRQSPSGRHVHWDALFATIHPRAAAKLE
jgi:hypothetical protein